MFVNSQNEHSAVVMVVKPYQDAWLEANRGVLTGLSRQLKVSRQLVAAVYRGKRRSKRVERALAKLRAPGFESRRAA